MASGREELKNVTKTHCLLVINKINFGGKSPNVKDVISFSFIPKLRSEGIITNLLSYAG